MSKSIVRAACGLLIMLVIIGGLAACGSKTEPDYANEIAESALQSMSDIDYATHIALYAPEIKETITEDNFIQVSQTIKSIVGDYIDKEFWKVETESSYTVVYYIANFSDEPAGVTVSFYFQEIDGKMYIAGFWLDSPKLSEFAGQ
jgi:hypothetical protein